MHTISLLHPDDLPAAFVIEQACHEFPWSKSTFYSNQGEHYLNLALHNDGILIGFAVAQLVLDEATVFNIAILPAYQRQGWGETLLLALIDKIRARNAVTIWLEVRVSNYQAIALYKAGRILTKSLFALTIILLQKEKRIR